MDACCAPGAAWAEFQEAEWMKLRKASFKGRLDFEGSMNPISVSSKGSMDL